MSASRSENKKIVRHIHKRTSQHGLIKLHHFSCKYLGLPLLALFEIKVQYEKRVSHKHLEYTDVQPQNMVWTVSFVAR